MTSIVLDDDFYEDPVVVRFSHNIVSTVSLDLAGGNGASGRRQSADFSRPEPAPNRIRNLADIFEKRRSIAGRTPSDLDTAPTVHVIPRRDHRLAVESEAKTRTEKVVAERILHGVDLASDIEMTPMDPADESFLTPKRPATKLTRILLPVDDASELETPKAPAIVRLAASNPRHGSGPSTPEQHCDTPFPSATREQWTTPRRYESVMNLTLNKRTSVGYAPETPKKCNETNEVETPKRDFRREFDENQLSLLRNQQRLGYFQKQNYVGIECRRKLLVATEREKSLHRELLNASPSPQRDLAGGDLILSIDSVVIDLHPMHKKTAEDSGLVYDYAILWKHGVDVEATFHSVVHLRGEGGGENDCDRLAFNDRVVFRNLSEDFLIIMEIFVLAHPRRKGKSSARRLAAAGIRAETNKIIQLLQPREYQACGYYFLTKENIGDKSKRLLCETEHPLGGSVTLNAALKQKVGSPLPKCLVTAKPARFSGVLWLFQENQWNRMFAAIIDGYILFWKSHEEMIGKQIPDAYLNLIRCTSSVSPAGEADAEFLRPISFRIAVIRASDVNWTTKRKHIYLSAESIAQRDDWMKCLEATINS